MRCTCHNKEMHIYDSDAFAIFHDGLYNVYHVTKYSCRITGQRFAKKELVERVGFRNLNVPPWKIYE